MRRKELGEVGVFLLTVIALSYFVFWGPIALFQIPTVNLVGGSRGPAWAIILFIIGGFVPSLTGLALTSIFEGKQGVKDLLRSSWQFKIGAKWFSLILVLSLYFAVSLIGLYSALGGEFDYSQFLVQLPTLIPLIILGPLSEEYGWRGFTTKRLLKHTNPNFASLVIGLFWALWHLPLFYMSGSSQHEFHMPFLSFLVTVTSLSFAYTYVYVRTKNSLFSAVFFHWLFTYVVQVVSSTVVRSSLYNWLECTPALIIGLVFMSLMHHQRTEAAQASSFSLTPR